MEVLLKQKNNFKAEGKNDWFNGITNQIVKEAGPRH